MRYLIVVWLCVLWPFAVLASPGSLFDRGGSGAAQFHSPPAEQGAQVPQPGGSLFAGRATTGLFAPAPVRPTATSQVQPVAARMITSGGQVDAATARLLTLISRAESPRMGYDAVQHGARVRPNKPPTQMTMGEILQWIEDPPNQPHAIGRYQIIPATLRRLITRLDLHPHHRFTPALQDQMAEALLADAGYPAFRRGEMGRHEFMNNLARIWAGLPNSSGQSHYHGYAGNRATVTWSRFDAEMAAIYPGRT